MDETADKVRDHYSVSAKTYTDHYDASNLKTSTTYPAEYFRLQNLLASLPTDKALRIIDAGCGEGTPLLEMSKLGHSVRGFDFTDEMVSAAKQRFAENGLNPDWVIEANIEVFDSFSSMVEKDGFDVAVCFGVMPHVNDETGSLKNLRRALGDNGKIFVEFRNQLFNLFTFNRYTHGYILDTLLADMPDQIREKTKETLEGRLEMNLPPLRTSAEAGKPGYDAIQARMHNPLDMPRLFKEAGFSFDQIHWYHFHPTLPMLDGNGVDKALFRDTAFEMEKNPLDPRGAVLCSAYVVEATAV
mgnify:CR=1 FL=1